MPISAPARNRANPYENPELLRWLDSYEGLPEIADPGESSAEQGLRAGARAYELFGLAALPIVVGAIAVALVVVTWLGRLLGLPRRLALLIAVRTGICGNTAILAAGPVIDADEDEMSYAVACVTIFALAMAAVGLGTSFAKLRVLGPRPFLAGMIAAVAVGAASFVLVWVTA